MRPPEIYVVGDPHGMYQELKQLLHKLDYLPTHDTCYILGDYVDRGPNSHEVIRFCRSNGILGILGNHDEKHLRVRRHLAKKALDPNYKVPVRFDDRHWATHNSLSQEDIDYLASLPHYVRLGTDFILVHGGLLPGRPEDQDTKLFCRMRYLDKTSHKMVSLGPNLTEPPNSIYWSSIWRGPETVLYGHSVHSLSDKPHIDGLTIGLDTGACFGGHLTAAVIHRYPDDKYRLVRFESVKATTSYSTWRGMKDAE